MRLNRYLQPYLQPYIACTALNQAFKISVLKLEFAFLDKVNLSKKLATVRLQVACSRAAKWQPQHAVVLVFAPLGFKEKKMLDLLFVIFIAARGTSHFC